MKRQRGRGRKPGGGGGGGHHHHQGNRPLESTGPDVKIRGTAAQIYEKYAQYARDAQSGGDRVRYETYLQHAEHYFRVMAATMPRDRMFPQQGEGGQPMPPQQGGEERPQGEGGQGGGNEQGSVDPMKVVDDNQSGDDDGDYEGDEGGDEEGGEGPNERVEASQGDGQGDTQNSQQGDFRGRRRRRGRRNRPHDQTYNQPNNNNSGGNGNSGNTNNDPEARSALDSLARKQGAFAND